jgi:hypothetical protein
MRLRASGCNRQDAHLAVGVGSGRGLLRDAQRNLFHWQDEFLNFSHLARGESVRTQTRAWNA